MVFVRAFAIALESGMSQSSIGSHGMIFCKVGMQISKTRGR